MAEIQVKDEGAKKKGKPKKMEIHIDFTPMVDMNMLLITFFMLCTSLSKPQTMEISMPSKDNIETEQTAVQESRAITLILGKEDKVYYYFGQPNYKDYSSLKETTYAPDGLRALLLGRNQLVVQKMRELKDKKKNLEISEEEFNRQATEIKKDKSSPIVMIKATDDSNYRNLIDALDEMQICNISKYAIIDMTDADDFLIENLESAGEYSKKFDVDGSSATH